MAAARAVSSPLRTSRPRPLERLPGSAGVGRHQRDRRRQAPVLGRDGQSDRRRSRGPPATGRWLAAPGRDRAAWTGRRRTRRPGIGRAAGPTRPAPGESCRPRRPGEGQSSRGYGRSSRSRTARNLGLMPDQRGQRRGQQDAVRAVKQRSGPVYRMVGIFAADSALWYTTPITWYTPPHAGAATLAVHPGPMLPGEDRPWQPLSCSAR